MRSEIGTVAIVLLLTSVGAGFPALADDTANSERGTRYLAPFKKDLMAALKAGLAEGPCLLYTSDAADDSKRV